VRYRTALFCLCFLMLPFVVAEDVDTPKSIHLFDEGWVESWSWLWDRGKERAMYHCDDGDMSFREVSECLELFEQVEGEGSFEEEMLAMSEVFASIVNSTDGNVGYAAWEVVYESNKDELQFRQSLLWVYIKGLMFLFLELFYLVLWCVVFWVFTWFLFDRVPRLFIDFRDSLTEMFAGGRR